MLCTLWSWSRVWNTSRGPMSVAAAPWSFIHGSSQRHTTAIMAYYKHPFWGLIVTVLRRKWTRMLFVLNKIFIKDQGMKWKDQGWIETNVTVDHCEKERYRAEVCKYGCNVIRFPVIVLNICHYSYVWFFSQFYWRFYGSMDDVRDKKYHQMSLMLR